MKVLSVISFLLISRSALADDDSLLVPCNIDDIECLGRSSAKFLERTHKGIPEHDIRSIDPLIIPSHTVVINDDITYKQKNLNITGLKNQDVFDFKLDLPTKSAVLTVKANISIVGEGEMILSQSSKTFSGSYEAHATTLTTVSYGCELRTDDKGVLHFEVGPETIICKVMTIPEIQFSSNLIQQRSTDEDLKKISKEKWEEARVKSFCSIVAESYKTVIHNLRTAAKLLPATAFFKNIPQALNNTDTNTN